MGDFSPFPKHTHTHTRSRNLGIGRTAKVGTLATELACNRPTSRQSHASLSLRKKGSTIDSSQEGLASYLAARPLGRTYGYLQLCPRYRASLVDVSPVPVGYEASPGRRVYMFLLCKTAAPPPRGCAIDVAEVFRSSTFIPGLELASWRCMDRDQSSPLGAGTTHT